MYDNDYNFKEAIADSDPIGLTREEDTVGQVVEAEDEDLQVSGKLKVDKNSFVAKNRYGQYGDDSDEDENTKQYRESLMNLSPTAQQKKLQEEQASAVGKLGPVGTFFTLFKGFVQSGIIYMPKDFVNGGYGFSTIALFLALVMTVYCINLLLQVRNKIGGSFAEIGYKTLGRPGKIITEITLVGSQVGFVTAYIYYIASQTMQTIEDITGKTVDESYKWYFIPICFVLFQPLVMIRKISVFAKFHIFGDVMIFVTLIAQMYFGAKQVSEQGWSNWKTYDPPLTFINGKEWPNAISFAVFAFEGVGVILPIYDITANKEQYMTVVTITCCFIVFVYVTFSEFCLFVYYDQFEEVGVPLIVEYLPACPTAYVIKVLFALSLIITYPLTLYPANMVIESHLYAGWKKSRKRQMLKNLNRACLVLVTIVLALFSWDKLDLFLSITGGLFCTPIAFILPAMFHYKVCAETKTQKCIDMFLIVLNCCILVLCTVVGVISFIND